MRVILLRSNPVDPDSRVEKEVNSLIKAGHQVEILAWDRNNKYKIKENVINLKSGGVKIYRFGIPATFGGGFKKNIKSLILFQIKMFIWLYKRKEKYDVIHACDFDTAYTSFQIAKLFKKKFVYDIFDFYVDSFQVPKYLKRIIKSQDYKIINSSDAVIICSENRRKQIAGSKPKSLYIIHNTPELDTHDVLKRDLRVYDLKNNRIKIVYVGILSDGRFIREIANLVKEDMNLEFHIGGFGEYESYFKDLSIKYDNIIFHGKLPYSKTLELENSCDIMVAIYDPSIPNHTYAAPNKFYEALMLGKPIIMAKNTGMDQVVSQQNIGEVINYDIKSLKLAFDNLIKRQNEWSDISQKMKKLYLQNYNWVEMEKRLIDLYKNLET